MTEPTYTAQPGVLHFMQHPNAQPVNVAHNPNSDIVPEVMAQQQQFDSTRVEEPVTYQPEPEPEKTNMVGITSSVLVILNAYSVSQQPMKDVLQSVAFTSGETDAKYLYDLYNPLSKADALHQKPVGVARGALIAAFSMSNDLNARRVTFVGKTEDIKDSVLGICGTLYDRMQDHLPAFGDEQIILRSTTPEGIVEERREFQTIVDTAIHSSMQQHTPDDDKLTPIVDTVNIVLTLTVSSAALAETKAKMKHVMQRVSFINNVRASKPGTAPAFLGIRLRISDLNDAQYRQFFAELMDSGFVVVTPAVFDQPVGSSAVTFGEFEEVFNAVNSSSELLLVGLI